MHPHPQSATTTAGAPRSSRSRRTRAGRLSRLALTIGTAAAVVAGIVAITSTAADAVKPAGSHVEILHGSSDPSLAKASDNSVLDPVTTSITAIAGTTAADTGCAADDLLQEAIVPTTADGSNERPQIPDDHTDITSAFAWTQSPTGFGPSVSEWVADDGDTVRALQLGSAAIYTHDSFLAGTSAGQLWTMWPAGTNLSLVVVCVLPDPDPTTGVYYVDRDADGYAITSWYRFVTVASTSNPSQTSLGWQIVAPLAAPQVALTAAFSADDTGATLTATLGGASGTLTDATGTVALYPGEDTSGTPIATASVVNGIATFPLTGLTPGQVVTYSAVYTPDDAASSTYTDGASDPTTFQVPAPAAATTTTLAVTGTRIAGQTQTLTATVTPAGATGIVRFTDRGATLGSALVAGGKATMRKTLAAGAHSVTATFVPSGSQFTGSASPATAVSIAAAPVASTTGMSATRATYGTSARVTVTVRGGATATGTVRLTGTGVSQARALSGGRTTFILPRTFKVGAHALSASYVGNATHKASVGHLTVRVGKRAASKPTIKVTTKPTRKKVGKAKITVAHPAGLAAATGKVTVTLKLGHKTKRVNGRLRGGKVTVKLPKLPKKGTWSVFVTYQGNADYTAKKSATVKVKVS